MNCSSSHTDGGLFVAHLPSEIGTDLIQGDEGLLARRDSLPDFFNDSNRHSIFGFLVAELRQKRIVLTTAEHNELLAGVGLQDLGLHRHDPSSIDFTAVANRTDLKTILTFQEEDSIVARPHAQAWSANHPFDVADSVEAIPEEVLKDALLNDLGQLAESIGSRRRENEGLRHRTGTSPARYRQATNSCAAV
jgi:hypothetical protein